MRAVIFDLDGVLIDSLPAHLRFARRMAERFQPTLIVPSPEDFKARVAAQGARISPMREFFSFLGFSPDHALQADEEYGREFSREPVSLFPGVVDMLLRLSHHGLTLGIVTANVRRNLESALGRWLYLFEPDCIFTDDDLPKRDKAAAITAAVEALNIEPSETFFVGDQIKDYEAAQAAKVKFLGVTYGWGITASPTSGDSDPFARFGTPAEVADELLRDIPAPESAAADYWKTSLEHAREMFTYHAGQRHASINFYFVALAIVMAGYGGLLAAANARFAVFVPFVGIVLGTTGAVVTACFGVLDHRNAQLVECDERLLKLAERTYARRLGAPEFETVRQSDSPTLLTYGNVMPFLFIFMIVLNLAAVAGFIWLGRHP